MFTHASRMAAFLAASVILSPVLPALAHHDGDMFRLEHITVSHAHSPKVSATAHSMELFVTVHNTGEAPAVLTAASVDFAADGVFQAPAINDDGTLTVQEVRAIEIAPGQTLTMQPGGIHIAFHDVKARLGEGDHFHATLAFEDLGELEIEVEIDPADHGHSHEKPNS